jgi:hypothetical protein
MGTDTLPYYFLRVAMRGACFIIYSLSFPSQPMSIYVKDALVNDEVALLAVKGVVGASILCISIPFPANNNNNIFIDTETIKILYEVRPYHLKLIIHYHHASIIVFLIMTYVRQRSFDCKTSCG